MRGQINDCLRWLIGISISAFGFCLAIVHRFRLRTFSWNQRKLRRRYEITSDTRILTFGPELEAHISRAAAQADPKARFATTSGTTAKPKRILFTNARLRMVRFTFVDMFARLCWSQHLTRASLYVFSSFNQDDSLTSLLLAESSLPSYISTLQAPYRVQGYRVIQSLVSAYGATAVRLWILAIANPSILYSTNPSTLSSFLETVAEDWLQCTRLIRDWCTTPGAFDPELTTIAQRLASSGYKSRLNLIAKSNVPLSLEVYAPRVRAYICWTGGYVQPFLQRVTKFLPTARYKLVPMYSMSTESIETVSHFERNGVSFLPLARRVLYEFVEEGAADTSANLRNSAQLQPGRSYSMVVSDSYGLRRYRTGDLFLCRKFVDGLPDLRFIGRLGLEYSFTGEKLTAEQVSLAFRKLREECAWLGAEKFLTCIPCVGNESKPHYKIILVDNGSTRGQVPEDQLARRCDELLGEINFEYRIKRESGRLAPLEFARLSRAEFVARVSNKSWETQFKFLPMYKSGAPPNTTNHEQIRTGSGSDRADAIKTFSKLNQKREQSKTNRSDEHQAPELGR